MWFTALLLACAAEQTAALPAEAGPPPALSASLFVAGREARLTVAGVAPGADVHFFRGTRPLVDGVCAPQIAPECVDLRGPLVVRTETADALGVASLRIFPPNGPEVDVPWQALTTQPLALSNVVVTRRYPNSGDADNDGLRNYEEVDRGTDLLNPDSDGGGVTDGDEVYQGTDPANVADEAPPTWASINGIIRSHCSPCHTGGGSGGVNFQQYNDVLRSSLDVPGMPEIDPGDTGNSYLIYKVNGTAQSVGGGGAKMPNGGPYLNESQTDRLEGWVRIGAPEH